GGTQDNGTDLFSGNPAWNVTEGGDGGNAVVDFQNPNILYHDAPIISFGPTAFLRKSTDGGTTWTSIVSGINANDAMNFVQPLIQDPTNSSWLLFGTDHVYETTNGGTSWTAIGTPKTAGFNPNGNPVDALAIAPSAPQTIYATAGGHIFVTTNDGGAWTMIDVPNVTDHFQDLEVDPSNSQIVYAIRDRFGAAQGQVFKSVNGGSTWTNITSNLPDLPAFKLAIGSNSNTLFLGDDNGVYVTQDGGTTWSRFGTGLPNVEVHDLRFKPGLSILAAGTHGRSVWEIATQVIPTPDLSITKTVSPGTVTPGANAIYTLTVSNNGTGASGTVTLTDSLPGGETLVSATGTNWTFTQAGATLTGTNSTGIAAGATSVITVIVKAPTVAGTYTNTATVSPTDPTPGDNTATASLTVSTRIVGGPEDRFEPNETSDRATNFGALPAGTQTFNNLTIVTHANLLPDYDWYRWSAGTGGTFQVLINITPTQGDLELHLFTLTADNTLVELAKSTSAGTTSRALTTTVRAGQPLLVEVKGAPITPGVFGTGSYTMSVTLTPPAGSAEAQLPPSDPNARMTSLSSVNRGLVSAVFGIGSDQGLYRLDAYGWTKLSTTQQFVQVSAGTDEQGIGDAYAVAVNGSLYKFDMLHGLYMVDGPGQVQGVNATEDNWAIAVTSDGSIYSYNGLAFGKGARYIVESAGFAQSLSATNGQAGDLDIFVVTPQQTLVEINSKFKVIHISDGETITQVSAGQDGVGNADAYAVANDGSLFKFDSLYGFFRVDEPGSVRQIIAAQADWGIAVGSSGQVYSYNGKGQGQGQRFIAEPPGVATNLAADTEEDGTLRIFFVTPANMAFELNPDGVS
ncbi:MAG: DUF11 domain-containing protein, partial [Planctomycetes bacterium]|nr:DUF11 domain-containing protein [Planctomycetota bacterium]